MPSFLLSVKAGNNPKETQGSSQSFEGKFPSKSQYISTTIYIHQICYLYLGASQTLGRIFIKIPITPKCCRLYLQFPEKGGAPISKHPPHAEIKDHTVHIGDFERHQLEGQWKRSQWHKHKQAMWDKPSRAGNRLSWAEDFLTSPQKSLQHLRAPGLLHPVHPSLKTLFSLRVTTDVLKDRGWAWHPDLQAAPRHKCPSKPGNR